MMIFLAQTVFVILMAVFQMTILDFFSVGSVTVDLVFAFIIYSGMYLDILRGTAFSLILGLFLDCLASPLLGLHIFLYILFFYISSVSSTKMNRENKLLIAFFTGVCLFSQGLLKIFFYWLIMDIDISYAIPTRFLPQSVATAFLSPFIYNILNHLEVMVNAEVGQPARRL